MGFFDYLEPAATLASGAAAEPLAGLFGLLGGGADGVRSAREAMTYQPRTAGGQQSLQALAGLLANAKKKMVDDNPPVRMMFDGYNSVADAAGDYSPALGAAVRTLPAAAGLLTGPGGAVGRDAFGSVASEMATNAMSPTHLSKQAGAYLLHTPQKPNPLVGTRYEREFVGNMAPKTQRRIEDMQGSSLLAMPWDSTSRGYNIKSVSDEVFTHPILTTGGQDFARDLDHISQNVGGASSEDIAKRIQDRVRMAAHENEHFGGNGSVYSLPTTMGAGGENFSTMPTDTLLGLIQNRDLAPSQINQINEWVRNSPVTKSNKLTRPFGGFAGVDTDEGLLQFITGEGIGSTAGELRKAFANEMHKVRGQQMVGFNSDDLINALTDPALQGVPKGYAGNTIIRSDQHGLLTPSDHPSYNTNFPGQYYGSLLDNIPIEHLMPKTYRSLVEEFAGKTGDMRTNVIGAMEKRKQGISEIVDQQVIDSVNNYLQRAGR